MARTAGRFMKARQATALALALFLMTPLTAVANHKKHFKEGRKYAENRQWDKAAERFALAAAEKPSNIEYQLNLTRALVNAGLMLAERGDMLAEKKDYNAAYHAYRQAFAFDRTNELARVKMRRMLEIQGLPTDSLPGSGDPTGPTYKRKDADPNVKASHVPGRNGATVQLPGSQTRRFPKTDVIVRSDSLLSIIEQLGQDMGLNVLFDQQVINQMRAARISVDLRNVTKPKALEMILKTNNLMYSQMDSRTIVIAVDNPASRLRYEPLSVRTFYIKNAELQEVRGAITSTLGTKQVIPVKQLNALIIRDSAPNLDLIESMINSLDKEKAEVLVDINIYEVSRSDLLQLGNQFNVPGGQEGALDLSFIGGLGQQGSVLGKGPRTLKGPLGFALGLPPTAISFFQDKGKAKLLASTQVHILDGEPHQIRIGQRVPIQTAFIPTFTNVIDQRRNPNQGQVNPNDPNQLNPGVNFGIGGGGFPQFQYENVGLNLDMTPNVYEDEIQLKMKIESSSIDRSTGNFTPSFNQRTMSSVARIKDGQTTMVAGVSQTEQAKSVKGIPLIGLIPILGRFFATPTTTDRQSDVVITVTPHILRRADIREEDHLARSAGTAQDSTAQLPIEHILYLADQEDLQSNQVAGGAPPPERPAAQPGEQPRSSVVNTSGEGTGVVVYPPPVSGTPAQPAPRNAPTPTENRPAPATNPDEDDDDDDWDDEDEEEQPQAPIAVIVRSGASTITKGQDLYVAVILNGPGELSSATFGLRFDPAILQVKGVRDGGLLRIGGANPTLESTEENGLLRVSMSRPEGAAQARGQLLLIIFTAIGQGDTVLAPAEDMVTLTNPMGQVLPISLQSAQIKVQ